MLLSPVSRPPARRTPLAALLVLALLAIQPLCGGAVEAAAPASRAGSAGAAAAAPPPPPPLPPAPSSALPAWLSQALSGGRAARGARGGVRRALSAQLGVTPECAASVQQRFNCSEVGCQDLVPGYVNYIEFYYCTAGAAPSATTFVQVLAFLLFVAWMAFLLHLVETTTNDYFCASLTLAVDALKLSPNVAGVTFLAVGNAACDVIASIAAFATNSPKVGVGTTLGAGVFVCCAVVGVVTFVADVRLARRSFVRDVAFFILAVLYLLFCSLDGYISLGEAIGFILIYVIFVIIVVGGRYIRILRSGEEEAKEEAAKDYGILGITDENPGPPGIAAAGSGGGGYNSAGAGAGAGAALPQSADEMESDMLHAIEAARGSAGATSPGRSAAAAAAAPPPPPPPRRGGIQPLGAPMRLTAAQKAALQRSKSVGFIAPVTAESLAAPPPPPLAPLPDFMADLPTKSSRWTRQFRSTQRGGGGGGGGGGAGGDDGGDNEAAAFRWTGYHKRQLALQLGKRLRARKVSRIDTPDGQTVDFLELLERDPAAAGNLAAAIATAVTVAAQRAGKALTYDQAAAAATLAAEAAIRRNSVIFGADELRGLDAEAAAAAAAAAAQTAPGGGPLAEPGSGYVHVASVMQPSGAGAAPSDFLSLLPQETVKPVTDCYVRARDGLAVVGPSYYRLMHFLELPFALARKLSVPMMHAGAYRRRLLCLVMPGAAAYATVIVTTHVLKLEQLDVAGVPFFVLGAAAGALLGLLLYFFLLPSKAPILPAPARRCCRTCLTTLRCGSWYCGSAADGGGEAEAEEEEAARGSLLHATRSMPAGAPSASGSKEAARVLHVAAAAMGMHGGAAAAAAKPHKARPWYKRAALWVAGPADEPLPTGALFGALLMLSFVLALFWLLLIATEIVGVAIFMGKVLGVPDIVMGLTVLAVGNSINDLAASLTIARDGYASMAIAGAYAGPMFNVLAGIGLPMLVYTSRATGTRCPYDVSQTCYFIGVPTLLVWLSYAALVLPLVATLVWVYLENWRMTHRLGRFLCVWFWAFVFIVIGIGFSGLSGGDTVTLA